MITRLRGRSLALAGALLALTFALSGGPAAAAPQSPGIGPSNFVRRIDNPYLPLVPGTTYIYEGTSEGSSERNIVNVTRHTKVILGVPCVVVEDTVYVDDELSEKTHDWYAQDTDGNVWYMGEDSSSYEHGVVVSKDGSWKAGVDGAQPGIVMEADPQVGDVYQQEYYAGVAEDMAQVLSINESISVAYDDYDGVIETAEWSPLEPDVVEHKYYAEGIGQILSISVSGEHEQLELVDIQFPRHPGRR